MLEAEGFKGPWVKHFIDIAHENIVLPTVTITGNLEVTSSAPDGVAHIQKALVAAEKAGGASVKVRYLAAPKYRVEVTAGDYKAAEATLKESVDAAVDSIKKSGGSGSFERQE